MLKKQMFVTVLCLPPHSNHRMQPLDVSYMKPLMTFYTQTIEKWLRNHPGGVVTTFQAAELFNVAYTRAATPTNAINDFKNTGIWPIDRNVFGDEEFAASFPTDIAHQPEALPRQPEAFPRQPEALPRQPEALPRQP